MRLFDAWCALASFSHLLFLILDFGTPGHFGHNTLMLAPPIFKSICPETIVQRWNRE
jgi:hypothetical protein